MHHKFIDVSKYVISKLFPHSSTVLLTDNSEYDGVVDFSKLILGGASVGAAVVSVSGQNGELSNDAGSGELFVDLDPEREGKNLSQSRDKCFLHVTTNNITE